jgi:hypothetical protein
MTKLFQGLLGIFVPGLAARAAAKPLSRLYEAGGPLADPLFHSRYRDELAIFESALIKADLRTLDDAAAKLTRMQDDFTARPAGPARASKETS